MKVWNYQSRRFAKLSVDLHNLAGNRGINITGGFNTLHGPKAAALSHGAAGLRHLHKHHFSKMALRKEPAGN